MTEDTSLFMDSLDSSKAEGDSLAAASDTHEADPAKVPTPPGEQEGASNSVRLVFLGKEINLPLDEAARWAQKGMNADHAIEKHKNAPEQELIGFYSALFGMNRSEFLESLSKNRLTVQTELELSRLKESNPELPEHLLLHAARLGAERRLKEFEEARLAQKEAEEAERSLPWQALAAKYPELKSTNDLPEEVLQKIDGGLSPLEAMLGYELERANSEIERLSALIETAENNGKNRSRSTGSAKSFGNEAAKDPFLLGILGA